jgi:hypothetical protein
MELAVSFIHRLQRKQGLHASFHINKFLKHEKQTIISPYHFIGSIL